MPYPCEEDPSKAKEHEMMKGGKKGDLRRKVDCAIESRDQWMVELTDWLKGLSAEVADLRQRVEACEGSSGDAKSGSAMMRMLTQDPPKPPQPWP